MQYRRPWRSVSGNKTSGKPWMARISLESPRAGRKDVRKPMQQEVLGPQEGNSWMSGIPSGYVCKASAQRPSERVPCSETVPVDHGIPYLEPFLTASLLHSSCNSSSKLGTYSLQILRALLHMPASCTSTTGRRNFHQFTRIPHSWHHITHLASNIILLEDSLEETTTAGTTSSFLPPEWHLCLSIHPTYLRRKCSSILATSVEWALSLQMHILVLPLRAIHILAGSFLLEL